MRRSTWSLLAFLALCAQAVPAQTAKAWDDTKPPWKWTLEERLAKRFDPDEIAARAALGEKRMQEEPPFPPGLPEWDEALMESAKTIINGRDTPELFTPMELFIHFVEGAYSFDGRDQRIRRQRVEEEAAALGFGADLWQRLRRVAAPYIKLFQEDHRIAIAEKLETGPTPPEVLCGARRDALDAALDEFGEEAFLRLLYEVVAPPLSTSMLMPENLRRWEGGCR